MKIIDEGVFRVSHSMYTNGLGIYYQYFEYRIYDTGLTETKPYGNSPFDKWRVGKIPKGAEIAYD